LAANRAQFFLDLASGPFYGFNRPSANVSQGIIQNWWRQGMMGGAKAHYDGIKAFSETDQTEDLKTIKVSRLVMQGDDHQVVPYKDAALLQAKLLKNSSLKIYPGFSHGIAGGQRWGAVASRRDVGPQCRPGRPGGLAGAHVPAAGSARVSAKRGGGA